MPHPPRLAEFQELPPRAQRWVLEWLQEELEACYRRMRLADLPEELRSEQGACRLLCKLHGDLRRSMESPRNEVTAEG